MHLQNVVSPTQQKEKHVEEFIKKNVELENERKLKDEFDRLKTRHDVISLSE